MADNIYLKLDGIPGSATDAGFEKQIVVQSFSFGAGVPVSGGTGNMADRTAGKASLADVSITKPLDTATHQLLNHMLKGKVIPKGTFTFVAATNNESEKYLEVTLENIIISAFQQSSSGDKPSEAVSLNYSKIEFSHQVRDEKGSPQPKRVSYDLKTNKAA
jgi:type VI secretion system secreted protein Hcp